MSATTEILTEQINQMKERISMARRAGKDCSELEQQCADLLQRLSLASGALNENKQILKG